MSQRKISAVLEGAFSNTTAVLKYEDLRFPISENARVLIINSARMLLYGRAKDNLPGNLVRFRLPDVKIRGIRLGDASCPKNKHWVDWVFDMPRALVVNDGRIYLRAVLFEEGFDSYLSAVPRVLADSRDILRGDKRSAELSDMASPAFD